MISMMIIDDKENYNLPSKYDDNDNDDVDDVIFIYFPNYYL